jgi:hypothetical protein
MEVSMRLFIVLAVLAWPPALAASLLAAMLGET